MLDETATRVGEPEEVMLSKALLFYLDALEAEKKGQKIAILNQDDEIVRELKGFGPPSENPSSQAE